VQITFDPGKTGLRAPRSILAADRPHRRGGQFADRGSQYRSVIFYHDPSQKRAAEASKLALERAGVLSGKVVTEILPAGKFFRAEEYHQDTTGRTLQDTGRPRPVRQGPVSGKDLGAGGAISLRPVRSRQLQEAVEARAGREAHPLSSG
jgi:hypothetical protein